MKFMSFLVWIVYPVIIFSAEMEDRASSSNAKAFVLTSQEMVFASKLSDENRRKFCYVFSSEERALALVEAKSLSPDESVEKVQQKDAL